MRGATSQIYWDRGDFDDTTGGDRNLQRRLVSTYISQTDELLKSMMGNIESKNFEDLQRIGHTLKGSSNSISALALGELGMKMENAAKALDLDTYMKNAKEFILLLKEFKKLQS